MGWKICNRGHKFQKSSDCPICPKCWSGYYRKQLHNDFPNNLSSPALRALLNEKISNLKQLAKFTEAEISELHGIGPSALTTLKLALKSKKLSFKK